MNPSRQASIDAWEVARKGVHATKRKILEYIDTLPGGATSDDVEQPPVQLRHPNCSARFRELFLAGLLIRTPLKRVTSSEAGTKAQVHFTPRHWREEYGYVDPTTEDAYEPSVVEPDQATLF